MARLIYADECYERAWECYPAFYHHVADMSILRDLLNDCPTVDAVPVVRCKDCLYYQETIGKDSGKPCGYGSCHVPGRITGIVYDEEFCSYGERKTDA